jgi:ubiquinone/menaquinone biosynthesis C-methylase UbiE
MIVDRPTEKGLSMRGTLSGRLRIATAVCVSAVVWAAAWGQSQTTAPPTAPQTKTDPTINEPFKKADVKAYIKKFESDDRELYKKRNEIVAALDLRPGMAVADIGAGTGLFTRLFADRVGPQGKVYAVDISPHLLAHIASEAKKRRHDQVVTIQGTQDSTNLPPDAVELVFVCDVYHHLEKPEKMLASIRQALKPGGRLVVIDFNRVEGKSTAFVLKHVRAGQEVFRKEILSAGFASIQPATMPVLKESFYLAFQKTADPLTNRQ